MTLRDYLKLTRGKVKALNNIEVTGFGVDSYASGWFKRNKDLIITKEQLFDVCNKLTGSPEHRNSKSTKKLSTHLGFGVKYENQKLYLMINELGNLKIGISVNPCKRAKSLSTGAGMIVKCLCYWDIPDNQARYYEKKLHDVFNNQRLLGEWFSSTNMSKEVISDIIGLDKKRTDLMDIDKEVYSEYKTKGIEFKYEEVRHVTDKATLFVNQDKKCWIANSRIMMINKDANIATVTPKTSIDFN